MVTDSQKAAIRNTWDSGNISAVGRSFYIKLSECAPEAYAVFGFGGEDVKTSAKVGAQGDKVMKFVDTAVKGLDDMGGVVSNLDALGQRHTSYKAKKCHFVGGGEALLFAVEKHAGGKWNADAKAAWTEFYKVISGHITAPLSA